MKKTIIYAFLTSAVLTSTAFATDDRHTTTSAAPSNPSSCANFNGFVAGALVGYGAGTARTQTNTLTTAPALPPLPVRVFYFQTNSDISVRGANGGVFVGYGKNVGPSKVHLGLNIGYIVDGARGKHTTPVHDVFIILPAIPGYHILVKRQDSIDIDARVGLVWGSSLPYFLVGWASSKLKASNYGVTYLSKRKNGLNVGVGVDWKMARHIVVGLLYKYTHFSKSGSGVNTSVNGYRVPRVDDYALVRSSLSDNKVQLKLAYHF